MIQPSAIIQIAWHRLPTQIDSAACAKIQVQLESVVVVNAARIYREADRYRFLAGRYLLKHLLSAVTGADANRMLSQIRYSETRRPFIPGVADFSISHSGNYVICALSESGKVGIDIEEIRPLNLAVHERILTSYEKMELEKNNYSMDEFFRIWAMKEATSKLLGAGIQIPFEKLETGKDSVVYQGREYCVEELKFDPAYISYVAVETGEPLVRMEEVEL